MGKPKAVEEKRCGKCKKALPIESFSFKVKKTGKRQSWCRDCHNTRSRQHYRDNHERHIWLVGRRKKKTVAENRQKLLAYLRSHPCVDCGKKTPIFLQFDHVRGKKKSTVPKMAASGFKWATVMAEINKCEVRCVECHILKTASKQGHWLLDL